LQSIPVAILSSKKSDSVIKKMIHTYPDSIPLFFFLLFSSLSVYWIVYFKSTFTFCMLISFFASAISSFWILFIYKEKKLFAKTLIFWTCLLPLYYIFFTSRKYNPYISNVNLKLFIVFVHSLIAYILFSFITKPRLKTEVVIVGNDKSNITSFLLAVVVVFYVFFYQPLHYYLSAPQEIGIPLSAFFIRISLLSLAIFSLFIFLFVLSSISKKRKMTEIILTVFMSAILWSSVLKLKTGMLDSFTFQFENVISQISFIKFIFDPFIIVMLFIAANFILDRYSKAVSVVSSLCLIVLSLSLGLAIINTSTEKSGSFEETSSELPATAQSNHRFSRTNTNVFFVIADMYNGNYVKKLVEHDSEYLNTLDGFVWYPDTLSVSYNTATSLPSMFGGDLFLPHILSGNDLTGSEELQIAAQSFFAAAKEKEYRITVANPMYFGPEHCSGATMENIYSYVNYWKSLNGIDSSRQDSAKAFLPIMLSLFNSAPWHLKSVIYDDSSWIIFRKSAMFIQMRNKAIKDMAYLDLLPTFAETTEGMGLFLYFHNELPHTPFGIGKDGNPIDGNFPEPNKPSFANPEAALYSAKKETDLLINFFNWMKKNNVYDNTIIVIVSDHGNPFFDSDIPKGSIPNNYFGDYDLSRAQSLLMVKGLNVRGPLVTDYATVSSADIRALLHSNKAFYPNDTFPKFPITDRKKRVYSSVAGDWEASLSRETVPFRTYSVSGPLSEKSSWSVLK
ncbi:MAG TPA: sulfatase-like hydrolase/transferase, partial [Treponema sp.]|nr:sulfatase-like hydrolase/transferase [Treponema sp.]